MTYQVRHGERGPFTLCTHPGGELRAILIATTHRDAAVEARRIVRDNPVHFAKSNATE